MNERKKIEAQKIVLKKLDLSPVKNEADIIKKKLNKISILVFFFFILIFSKIKPKQINANPKIKCPIFFSSPKKLPILVGSLDLIPNNICPNIN